MTLRSFLFVPGDSPRKLEKGLAAGADALILDLEDSVAASAKAAARAQVAQALAARAPGGPELWVRINPLSGPDALADLAAVAGEGPDGIVLPKAEGAADLTRLSHYLDALEARAGLAAGAIRIMPIATETPRALFTLESYTSAEPRLVALTWGAEDLTSALGATTNKDPAGGYSFTCRLARSLCLAAAHASEVQAIETVYPDFRDLEGLELYARAGRWEGFSGMMAIHPDQVAPINAAFTPSPEEIAAARRIADAFAATPDAGVVSIDGRMVDQPHLKAARRVLEASARRTR
jgi:citrate lyase subunit beta/citryl-CoA lyase